MITVSIKIIGAVTTMGSALINTPYINLKIDAKSDIIKNLWDKCSTLFRF